MESAHVEPEPLPDMDGAGAAGMPDEGQEPGTEKEKNAGLNEGPWQEPPQAPGAQQKDKVMGRESQKGEIEGIEAQGGEQQIEGPVAAPGPPLQDPHEKQG